MNDPITEQELHAYIDNELDVERQKAVERYLQENPEKAEELANYQQINSGLHQLFDPILEEPIPASLNFETPKKAPFISLAQAASLLMAVVIGCVFGWFSHDQILTNPIEMASLSSTQDQVKPTSQVLVKDAMAYHAVYTPEVLHPVEVTADKQEHLVKWLTKRLKTPIKVPNLEQYGFQLLGGRLLKTGELPAAQFMFENSHGERLTLFLRHKNNNEAESSFRFVQHDQLQGFFWFDNQQSFVLLSELPKSKLAEIAHTVYQNNNDDEFI